MMYPSPPGEESVGPSSKIFNRNGVLWCIMSGLCLRQKKNVDFPSEVEIWWTLKKYFWEYSECSVRVMGW